MQHFSIFNSYTSVYLKVPCWLNKIIAYRFFYNTDIYSIEAFQHLTLFGKKQNKINTELNRIFENLQSSNLS